jgi:bifunctional non-homologous end joining protein LigD
LKLMRPLDSLAEKTFTGMFTSPKLMVPEPIARALMAATVAQVAPPPRIRAEDVELQLAEPREAAFTAPGWYFELKLDGFRLLAERIGGVVRLVLRRGREATAQFPEVVRALTELPGGDFLLDGELVIQDAAGHPVFQRLLRRSTLRGAEAEAAALRDPAVYFGFDCLMDDGVDLRPLPLSERKARLRRVLPRGDRVLPLDHVEAEGEALLEAVRAQGLEGVVAKRADAPYRGGRSDRWLKVPLKQVGDFAVVGWADDWGALSLATCEQGRYVYAGKVGSGFTPRLAAELRPRLLPTRAAAPPCVGEPPREKETVWCRPTLVVEVRYKSWPPGLSLREPVFLRVRDDKAPEECQAPRTGQAPEVAPAAPVTNPTKLFFPEDGLTKSDVVAYYRAVSPWLLPYLRDRPLLLTRYPDGIHGKSFFQKARPAGAPDFLRTVRVRSDEDQRELDQLVCDDLRTLEWCAGLGAIPLHLPAGRVASLERADWTVVDFDPKEAPFASVVTLALALRELCEAVGLPCFAKTSGASGLHVLVPLAAQLDHAGARQLALLLSTLVVRRHPALGTLERVMARRGGRVYLDALQNGSGKVLAAPLCLRPLPTAPVSMPVTWDEVTPALHPRQFTLRDAVGRLEKRGDPMVGVLTTRVDLAKALERLGALG